MTHAALHLAFAWQPRRAQQQEHFALPGPCHDVLVLEHHALRQGGLQYHARVAETVKRILIVLPAEHLDGGWKEQVVSGPPTAGQQIGNMLLEHARRFEMY